MFKLGDKVVLKTPGVGNISVGEVSISPKENRILFDFGSYKYSFSRSDKIEPHSPRIDGELLEVSIINKCRRLLENKFTHNEAVQIINILEGNDEL